jgi:ABC-type nickel/cobalt efflux system permease component RcnA
MKLFQSLLASLILISLITLEGLSFPDEVIAHPLDEFYQATFVTIVPNRITMRVELYTGVLIAPEIMAMIDTDRNDEISEAEGRAYVQLFLEDVIFEIDDKPIPLTVADIEFPSALDLKAGVGVIRFKLYTDLLPDHRGQHQFFYHNRHRSDLNSVYMVSALRDAANWVEIMNQERDVFQASLRVDYTIKPEAPIDYGENEAIAEIEVPGGVTEGQKQLTRYLYDTNLSPLFLLIALGLSAILGGLHALTPGHGKTLVAAYLVGSRGTVGHAVALGGIVTFTHTASVIAIGLLALLASQFIVPNVLVPALEILSGLLVVYLGLRLVWTRWRAYRNERHDRHDHHHHDHHHHLPEQVELRDLLTLGISGGLVPCPEALGVMLIAIGLNRILLGLGMVVAFSFGLAVILIIIGVLLVRSKSLLDRLGGVGGRWQTLLPVVSAAIVTGLGLGIMVKGLLPYLVG